MKQASKIGMPLADKVLVILFILLFGIALGYGWRIHHEKNIIESQDTQAQQDLYKLENEFEQAIEKPHQFLIFNGRFKVWPLKNEGKTKQFSYAGAGDTHKEGK